MNRYFVSFNDTLGEAVYNQPAVQTVAEMETATPMSPEMPMEAAENLQMTPVESLREEVVQRQEPVESRQLTPEEAQVETEPTPIAETEEMTGSGYLIVQVSIAQQAIPIAGAEVVVRAVDSNEVWTLITDESGLTPLLELPAPSRALSQYPGNIGRTYSTYNTRVTYPGYYVEENLNIPVFDGIKSIQPISLLPLPENANGNEVQQIDEAGDYLV